MMAGVSIKQVRSSENDTGFLTQEDARKYRLHAAKAWARDGLGPDSKVDKEFYFFW